MFRSRLIAAALLACVSLPTLAAEADVTNNNNTNSNPDPTGLGAGPAFYVLRYADPIIEDSRDVRLRSNGTVEANETRTSTSLGVEVHYRIGLTYNIVRDKNDSTVVKTWGWSASPYLGVFDVSNGINGVAVGLMGGVWRGDKNGENQKALNIGIGYFTHKNRVVLADDVTRGQVPPPDLEPVDFTRKRDVDGLTLTISASVGF